MKKSVVSGALYWLAFALFGVASLVAMTNVGIYAQAVLFLLAVLAVMKRFEKKSLVHPLSWFPIFYFLYSVSFPLYYMVDGEVNNDLLMLVPICFSGFLAFTFGVLIFSPHVSTIPKVKLSARLLEIFAWLALCICAGLIIYVLGSGVSSKREFLNMVRASGLELAFNIFSFATVIYVLRLIVISQSFGGLNVKVQVFDRLGIAMLLIFMAGFGVTGERDFVFRLLLLTMVVLFGLAYRYKYYYLLVATFALVLILPFSQAAKAYLISTGIEYEGYKAGDIFNTEFASAGRNTYYVIARDITGYGGETILWDIKRYFNFIFADQQSTGVWFNDYIRRSFGDEGTSGWGFSLVAEGYMNFGIWGAAILFFVIGIITGFVYRLSSRSGFYYAIYLLYIPTLIYVVRADVANYLSLAFKVNIVMVLIVYASAYFLGGVGGVGGRKRELWG